MSHYEHFATLRGEIPHIHLMQKHAANAVDVVGQCSGMADMLSNQALTYYTLVRRQSHQAAELMFCCRYVAKGQWQYRQIKDAGHWIPRDAPDELSKLVLDFLSSNTMSKL